MEELLALARSRGPMVSSFDAESLGWWLERCRKLGWVTRKVGKYELTADGRDIALALGALRPAAKASVAS